MNTEELAERLQDTEAVLQQQGKRMMELEAKADRSPELIIPDYSPELNAISRKLEQVAAEGKLNELTNKVAQLTEQLKKQPAPVYRQIRILLFPETNQAQYYRIVFGRLIPWGTLLLISTYVYFLAQKAVDGWAIERYNQQSEQCVKAWLYMNDHGSKQVKKAMDQAWLKSSDPKSK